MGLNAVGGLRLGFSDPTSITYQRLFNPEQIVEGDVFTDVCDMSNTHTCCFCVRPPGSSAKDAAVMDARL